MSWLATETMTAHLPDAGGLRAAAYNLRNAGDSLGTQAATVRGIADAIGPGLWQDGASGKAKSTLNVLNGELSSGYSALHQSADALDTLASYVDGQRWRYEEAGQEFEGLARDPFGAIEHHELGRAEQLVEERRSIESSVASAMGHSADLINQAAARATRYHGRSFWSALKHDVGSLEHGIADLVSGIWDGTYAMGKGLAQTLWSLAVLDAKLSPERFLLDPKGFMHDAEHAYNTFVTTIDALAHNKKAFVEKLLNLQELKSDPVHWVGELIPTIISIVVLKGAGSVGDSAEGADAAVNAASDSAAAARTLATSLKAMSVADRRAYLNQVIQQFSSKVPRISEINVNGTEVHFSGHANFGFNEERLDHVTIGTERTDGTYSGGHLYPGFGSKPAFPPDWTPSKIVANSYQLMQDPATTWRLDRIHPGDIYIAHGEVDGVEMEVVVQPGSRGIVTSYPYVEGYHQ